MSTGRKLRNMVTPHSFRTVNVKPSTLVTTHAIAA